MNRLLFIIIGCLAAAIAFSACNSDSKVREQAAGHFDQIYNVEGQTHLDTVVFLNTSIPQLILADDAIDASIEQTTKNMGWMMVLLALGSKSSEEGGEMLLNSFSALTAPYKAYLDSLHSLPAPSRNVALVRYSFADTIAHPRPARVVYILSDDKTNPVADSIIVSKKLMDRISFMGLVSVDFANIKDMTEDEFRANIERKLDHPVYKFMME